MEKDKTRYGRVLFIVIESNLKTGLQERQVTRQRVLVHHDNAPVHSSGVVTTVAKLTEFQLIPHPLPLYFPDLAPSDYRLVTQYETMAGRKEILLKRGDDCGNAMPILQN